MGDSVQKHWEAARLFIIALGGGGHPPSRPAMTKQSLEPCDLLGAEESLEMPGKPLMSIQGEGPPE